MISPRQSTVREAVADAAGRLRRAGVPDPEAEAEYLLASLLETDRGGVLARAPDVLRDPVAASFDAYVRRRAARVPFHYITGVKEFRGLPIQVDPRVLVPRPETEQVVDEALRLPLPAGARAVDLGTGSGCIALALAAERPDLVVFGLDVSEHALDVARSNEMVLPVGTRVRWVRGSMVEPPEDWRGTMGLVISNPPYVSRGDWEGLEPEVRDHEPELALVAGASGLEMYRALAPAAFGLLEADGWLVLELGYGSEAGARRAVESAGFVEIGVSADMQGIPRVLVARRDQDPGLGPMWRRWR